MTARNQDTLPPFVTFEGLAALLREHGIDPDATGHSVRHIARTRKDWPIGEDGDGKPHVYVKIGNARTMPTQPALDYMRNNPRAGRGRDTKPRKRRSSGGAS